MSGRSFIKVVRILGIAASAFIVSFSAPVYSQYQNSFNDDSTTIKNQNVSPGNLVEQIPEQFRNRYNRWKATLLSTEEGRRLWAKYAENPAFRLTIVVSKKHNMGAEIGDYQWKNRKLIGTTINLGHQLDQGFPSIINYPVLGSLASVKEEWGAAGSDVLAAAKLAHELGHIDYAAQSDPAKYQLQNELSAIFIDRLLKNGHNPSDPELVELERQMGGSPTQISMERENWAETSALRFLKEKLKSKYLSELLKEIRKLIQTRNSSYSPPLQTTWSILTRTFR